MRTEVSERPAIPVTGSGSSWVFCVACAVAVPAWALHSHLRVCSGTTSA
ncbi:MAG: hypothetical protein HY728_09555 [Candidatus Rokubacteria bacterium]|nr:hypothetical protein [Candidatus Rokubacteria bacterium]